MSAFSDWFSRAAASLPTPKGERAMLPATGRKGEGAPPRDELERDSRAGIECETVSRMPGWVRYSLYLSQEMEKVQKTLEVGDFGKDNEGLKAAQARLCTLRECAGWMDGEIKRGEEARTALGGQ